MAYKLTRLLDVLEDGKWHETRELYQIMDINDREVEEITDFLGKYSFVEVDKNKKRMRINKDFKEILAKSTDSKTTIYNNSRKTALRKTRNSIMSTSGSTEYY